MIYNIIIKDEIKKRNKKPKAKQTRKQDLFLGYYQNKVKQVIVVGKNNYETYSFIHTQNGTEHQKNFFFFWSKIFHSGD